MKVHLECFPCFLKQAVIAARLGRVDAELQLGLLKGVMDEVKAIEISRPPAYSATFLHRKIREIIGKDPFREIKTEYNQLALGLYPELKRIVRESPDPLWTAARLAIAGNIIDFGIFTSVDITGTIDRALATTLTIDDYSSFKKTVEDADDILYLLDNAGEIVFDRLLIELLTEKGKRVKAVVKGQSVLNDCTWDDAVESGLTEVCTVIDNGSDCVGTLLELTSPEFVREFESSPFILSKGQGNFESLCDYAPPGGEAGQEIFFLLQAKCDVLAAELGISRGSMLLARWLPGRWS